VNAPSGIIDESFAPIPASPLSRPPFRPPYHKGDDGSDALGASSVHGRDHQEQLNDAIINGLVAALEYIHVKASDRIKDLREGGEDGTRGSDQKKAGENLPPHILRLCQARNKTPSLPPSLPTWICVSPSANEVTVAFPGATPKISPTSFASPGWDRPLKILSS